MKAPGIWPGSPEQGTFIAVSGIDGSSKSTQVKYIAELLESYGKKVILTREPGGTPMAERIRELVLDNVMFIDTTLLLMFAARNEHVYGLIKPALNRGEWVVCDRFVECTYGLQGGGWMMGEEKIDVLAKYILGDFKPDITFLFDLPVEVAQERLLNSGKQQNRLDLESRSFHERTRQMYLSRAAKDPTIIVINANQDIESVRNDIKVQLDKYYNETN